MCASGDSRFTRLPRPVRTWFDSQSGKACQYTGVHMPRGIDPIGDIVAVARLYRALRWIRPDIVQAGTPQGGLLGTIAATLARVPVRIYHIRGLPLMTATGPRRRVLWATEKISCRLAHRVLCVSHSIREVAIAEGLCPPEKITVLCGGSGNGVDAEGRFNPAKVAPDVRAKVRQHYAIPLDAPVLGFVGRFHSIKGVSELVDAWKVLPWTPGPSSSGRGAYRGA